MTELINPFEAENRCYTAHDLAARLHVGHRRAKQIAKEHRERGIGVLGEDGQIRLNSVEIARLQKIHSGEKTFPANGQ